MLSLRQFFDWSRCVAELSKRYGPLLHRRRGLKPPIASKLELPFTLPSPEGGRGATLVEQLTIVSLLDVCRFLKIRNHEAQFFPSVNKMRNFESNYDSIFIPL